MKIAHISSTFPPDKGGMGNAAYHMTLENVKAGNEVWVFTPYYRKIEEVNSCKINVVRLKSFIKYGKAAILPQLFFKLQDFDILHLHYPFFGAAEVVWLLKKIKPQIPLIVHYHMDEVGRGLKSVIYKIHGSLFLKKIVSSADRVIVSSLDYAASSCIKEFILPEKMTELPYGVSENIVITPQDTVFRNRLGVRNDEVIILFAGSMEYYKGIDVLIKGIPLLKGRVKVILAGKGPMLEEHKNLTARLGLTDKICFPGFLTDDELLKCYNLSDIFVLPSIDRSEAFGIVLIEAMACAKPVISSNLPGIRTVVDDGINGFLVNPGSVEELAGRMQILIDNKELRCELGKRGREKIKEKYSWEKIGSELNNIYLSVK